MTSTNRTATSTDRAPALLHRRRCPRTPPPSSRARATSPSPWAAADQPGTVNNFVTLARYGCSTTTPRSSGPSPESGLFQGGGQDNMQLARLHDPRRGHRLHLPAGGPWPWPARTPPTRRGRSGSSPPTRRPSTSGPVRHVRRVRPRGRGLDVAERGDHHARRRQRRADPGPSCWKRSPSPRAPRKPEPQGRSPWCDGVPVATPTDRRGGWGRRARPGSSTIGVVGQRAGPVQPVLAPACRCRDHRHPAHQAEPEGERAATRVGHRVAERRSAGTAAARSPPASSTRDRSHTGVPFSIVRRCNDESPTR